MCRFCNDEFDDIGLPCRCCHELQQLYRADDESGCPESLVVVIIGTYFVLIILFVLALMIHGGQ